MKAVCIIPARGGSKGIPRKNLIDFCGHPLLAWSILQARQAERVEEIYVTSDDPEILAVANQYGAHPIERPAEIAGDTATSEEALQHALDHIRTVKGKDPEVVAFLQCTSPLRTPDDIDGAVEALEAEGADSLFSMAVLEDFCAWSEQDQELRSLTYDYLHRGRRQDRKPLYLENGSIYLFRPQVLARYNNRLGGKIAMFAMESWKSWEVDSPDDIVLCAFFFQRHDLGRYASAVRSDLPAYQEIELLVYDFDGVMTDNRTIVDQNGKESVIVSRADGLGIDMLRKRGLRQLILSTEANPVVRARAAKLKLPVIGNCPNKLAALENYAQKHRINLAKVIMVGNDLNDLDVMQAVGWPVSPSDGHPMVRMISKMILSSQGGQGVIKELAENILKTG